MKPIVTITKTETEAIQEAKSLSDELGEIMVKAEGRDLTREETVRVKAIQNRANFLRTKVAEARGDADLIDAVKAFGQGLSGGSGPVSWIDPSGRPTGSKGLSWGDTVEEMASKAGTLTGAYGAKALIAAGSVKVPQASSGIQGMPRRSNFIQDLLRGAGRVETVEGTDRFTFWRQTVRDFNAAPVAPGALKPTSHLEIARAEDRVRVIAHVSDPIAETDLADFADLKAFINTEMELGFSLELAHQIVNGDGLGENIVGIRNANGHQVHSRGTDDFFKALRKARGKLENQDVPLDGAVYLMHPTDIEVLDLEKDATGRYYFEGPRDGGADQVWKVPVIPTKETPPGEQIIMDLSAVTLRERETPQIAAAYVGDGFVRNQIVVRCEGRYGLEVNRPFLIVRVVA